MLWPTWVLNDKGVTITVYSILFITNKDVDLNIDSCCSEAHVGLGNFDTLVHTVAQAGLE
jgi:hypothetical protein